MIVTAHAAERFQERIAPTLTLEQCRATMLSAARAVEAAAAFGCRTVKMACGAKLLLEGDSVVTVVPVQRRRRVVRS